MAISFNQAKGEAQKNKIDSYQYVEGDNKIRMVGDMLPRYVYWLKGENGKNLPFECLSFDRNTEAFTNVEKDWVREYHPELKCGWSYAIQCLWNCTKSCSLGCVAERKQELVSSTRPRRRQNLAPDRLGPHPHCPRF